MSSTWEALAPAPFEAFCEPLRIAEDKHIFVPYMWRRAERNIAVLGIFEFNAERNEWTPSVEYCESVETSVHGAAFDKENNVIYVYNAQREIILIDLVKQTCQVYIAPMEVGMYCKCMYVHDKLHVIGGDASNLHFTVNIVRHDHQYKKSVNDYQVMHMFDDFGDRLYGHCVLHLESQHCLLLIGGVGESMTSDRVYRYSLQNPQNGWQLLPCNVPQAVGEFGYVLTNDEKYVLVFDDNLIFRFDTESLQWTTSKVAVPQECGRLHALITNNRHKAELLVVGFLNSWKHVGHIPMDVATVILAFYTIDYVHLFEHYGDGKQWRIPLFQLLAD